LLAGEILTKSEEFSSSKVKRLFDGVFLAELGLTLGRTNFGEDASAVFGVSFFARSRKLLRNDVGVETTAFGESWRR
jgi:hypothetical protein